MSVTFDYESKVWGDVEVSAHPTRLGALRLRHCLEDLALRGVLARLRRWWRLGVLVSGGGTESGAVPSHLAGWVRRHITAWLGTEDT